MCVGSGTTMFTAHRSDVSREPISSFSTFFPLYTTVDATPSGGSGSVANQLHIVRSSVFFAFASTTYLFRLSFPSHRRTPSNNMAQRPFALAKPSAEHPPNSITCAICLDPWDEPVELVPCGHVFCRCCISDGAIKNCHNKVATTCAICRQDVDGFCEPHPILIAMAGAVEVTCRRCHWQGTRRTAGRHLCNNWLSEEANTGKYGVPVEAQRLSRHSSSAGVSDESSSDVTRLVEVGQAHMLSERPWFDFNLKKDVYLGMKAEFETRSRGGIGLRQSDIFELLVQFDFQLKEPGAELDALFSAFQCHQRQNGLLTFPQLLTWLKYSTATRPDDRRKPKTQHSRPQDCPEEGAADTADSRKRIDSYVRETIGAPSVEELSTQYRWDPIPTYAPPSYGTVSPPVAMPDTGIGGLLDGAKLSAEDLASYGIGSNYATTY